MRQKLVDITDRFAGFEAQSLNVHVDFPLFQKIALPVASGKTKIAGIKIHDRRMMRLMEVLLHGGTQLNGWRSADIHQAILTSFGLPAARYTLTQLRYDVRKMKTHGLLERNGGRYLYRLTDKGTKVALMFVLFHQRVCGPLANSLFHRRPDETLKPTSKIPPTTKPITPSNNCSISSPRECYGKILRDVFSDSAMLETSVEARFRSESEPHGRRASQ